MNNQRGNTRRLSQSEISLLESQGCLAQNWESIRIDINCDLNLIRDVEFFGSVAIGRLDRKFRDDAVIRNVVMRDVAVGDDCRIVNTGLISGAQIGNRVTIENTGRIIYSKEPACGIGLKIFPLDETGSRPVVIYPGLSAQIALLMARLKRSEAENIYHSAHSHISEMLGNLRPGIGDGSSIIDSGEIEDVNIDSRIKIIGARSLRNGSVINNVGHDKESFAKIGSGVDADGFIIEDAEVGSGTILRNCFVGQGVVISNGFTAHDSLFFSNCTMENGEACALFAGPYTVSMHKGTLLIGCQTSFMNAGSSSNQSNHMYKLGPVHWGVLQRGVKTSSGSYLMLGANIGAFSLLMGNHKNHPDSSEFPFSYLFGDASGATVVVPAIMLRSCGLLRDQQKWPSRDRRKNIPLHDRINFPIFNPVTIDAMLNAIEVIRKILSKPADDDHYHRYKGMKITRASLERALKTYRLGIMKYLALTFFPENQERQKDSNSIIRITRNSEEQSEGWKFPARKEEKYKKFQWIDLAGQIVTTEAIESVMEADSINDAESILDEVYKDYAHLERLWIAERFPEEMRPSAAEILQGAQKFDRLVEIDRMAYRDEVTSETEMLKLK